ncbi:cysteine-rich venom protein TEL1-like [Tubulanus polymorphus]|uniref:cysteine-rich venom protein TEL1-like n=1 Tax=Tubulanus polymorphus TaxID=672921 RepID=UPI003DA2FA46
MSLSAIKTQVKSSLSGNIVSGITRMLVYIGCLFLSCACLVSGQVLNRGFTKDEKQKILDLHNELRGRVAAGQVSRQPAASNMIAMEWDDRLERNAQRWADSCAIGHNSGQQRKFKPYASVGQNYAGNYGIEMTITGWFDEYADYTYNGGYCVPGKMCGHYTQMIWWNSIKVGCGWNKCSSSGMFFLVCDYAPGGNTNFDNKKDPAYATGSACSNCPVGFGKCMSNKLCASSKMCKNSQSDCRCTIKSCQNGQFDSNSCSCKCRNGFTGLRCEKKCKDEIDFCKGYVDQGGCAWDFNLWMWMGRVCKKSCDTCGAPKDAGAVDSARLKTNVKKVPRTGSKSAGVTDGDVSGGSSGGGGGGSGGSCRNKHNSSECNYWAGIGECKKNPSWMSVNCAKSCRSC